MMSTIYRTHVAERKFLLAHLLMKRRKTVRREESYCAASVTLQCQHLARLEPVAVVPSLLSCSPWSLTCRRQKPWLAALLLFSWPCAVLTSPSIWTFSPFVVLASQPSRFNLPSSLFFWRLFDGLLTLGCLLVIAIDLPLLGFWCLCILDSFWLFCIAIFRWAWTCVGFIIVLALPLRGRGCGSFIHDVLCTFPVVRVQLCHFCGTFLFGRLLFSLPLVLSQMSVNVFVGISVRLNPYADIFAVVELGRDERQKAVEGTCMAFEAFL